jgi:dUTP pyrophosphatase
MIKVVLDKGAYMPEKAHEHDAGYDLRTSYGKTIPAGGSAVFDTGVHIAIPEGFAGEIVSRSGLNIRQDIVCPQGTVDAGYTGSIKVKLYNLGNRFYEIRPGDKIAQLIIVPIAEGSLKQVEELDDTERGDNGFGSSGR